MAVRRVASIAVLPVPVEKRGRGRHGVGIGCLLRRCLLRLVILRLVAHRHGLCGQPPPPMFAWREGWWGVAGRLGWSRHQRLVPSGPVRPFVEAHLSVDVGDAVLDPWEREWVVGLHMDTRPAPPRCAHRIHHRGGSGRFGRSLVPLNTCRLGPGQLCRGGLRGGHLQGCHTRCRFGRCRRPDRRLDGSLLRRARRRPRRASQSPLVLVLL